MIWIISVYAGHTYSLLCSRIREEDAVYFIFVRPHRCSVPRCSKYRQIFGFFVCSHTSSTYNAYGSSVNVVSSLMQAVFGQF
jgi:hypothetical protein